MTRYRTIVADPPWDVRRGPWSLHDKEQRSRPLPYPTLPLADIASLPVGDLAEADAHLYLWTVNAYLRQAYDVVEAWGFSPVTMLVWAKPPRGRGLGGTFGLATEFCLFARCGSLPALGRVDRNWWSWTRRVGRNHSTKPDGFLDIVEQVSPGPYLELFARRARFGWDYYGDESLGTAELPKAAT